MQLNEFNQSPIKKIAKINAVLKEHFGISVGTGFPKRKKLETVLESAETAIIKLRGSNKKFQLEADYAKFLGIRDIVETMLNEGMYAESPAYMSMKAMVEETVRNLMDRGYTMDEATKECMNRYRMDDRFAYDDDHVMPIVITAAKKYMEECGSGYMEETSLMPETDMGEMLIRELAREVGIKLEGMTSYDALEEKLAQFAEASGKSRDAVVGFLNSLDENSIQGGIQMFGRKIGEQNAFVNARRNAIKAGEKKFTVGGKEFEVTGNTKDEMMGESAGEEKPFICVHAKHGKCEVYADTTYGAAKKAAAKWKMKNTAGIDVHRADITHSTASVGENFLDSLVNELLNEEVDVEQAEVVMAVRALADDIQDQVERIGRMINEDLPAIVDQMRSEMGADAAQAFMDNATGVLNAHLESAKTAKTGMDGAVGQLTGEAPAAPAMGDTGLDDTATDLDAPAEEPAADAEMDTNEPAAAGPEDEPLGRASI
jgi:hypothetical protein